MKKQIITTLILIILLLSTGCVQIAQSIKDTQKNIQKIIVTTFPPEITPNTNIYIEYKSDEGLSLKSYTLTIYNDGRIVEETFPSILEEEAPKKQTKTRKISRKELEELAQTLIEKNIFSLEDEYAGHTSHDAPSESLTVTIGNNTKTIYVYPAGYGPKEFYEIVKII